GDAAWAGLVGVGLDDGREAVHAAPDGGGALRVGGGGGAVDDAVLQVAEHLAEPLLLLVVDLVGDAGTPADGAGGLHRAGDLDGGGEDLGVVALAGALGDLGDGAVVALQGGVAEDEELEAVGERAGGGAAVAGA